MLEKAYKISLIFLFSSIGLFLLGMAFTIIYNTMMW